MRVVLLISQVDLPGLGQDGPDDLRSLLTTSFILLAVGFAVGVTGHLTQTKTLIGAGIALIFVATIFFVLAVGQYG